MERVSKCLGIKGCIRYCSRWVFPSELPLKVFKTHLLGRFSYPYKKYFDLLSNRYEISQNILIKFTLKESTGDFGMILEVASFF